MSIVKDEKITESMKDDVALVAAALSDGPEAFGPIIERYQDAVFAVALARLRNFHDAEDIAQEVFIDAFERLDRLKDPSRLGTWLRSIAIHKCIDHLRQRREVIDVDKIAEQLEDPSTPHTEMEQQELRNLVMAAIGRLSKVQRETTTLFYINGYSQEEVARIQEVPIGTVKRRLHDAREKLKKEMINLVEDVLKAGAPKEDFGKQVFEILSRYRRPAVPWQKWDEIASRLREIGTEGMDGFIKALESPHSRTRIFATRMFLASMQSNKIVEELLKKSLTDSSKKVRKIAFLALLGIMARDNDGLIMYDEDKCRELMPYVLPLLTDKSKLIRGSVAGYLRYYDGCAKYVPLAKVARAIVNEKDPGVRQTMEELMRAVLDAQEHQ
jgi:RNA polymerase sigma-70 factor (ECF subfamily)